MSAIVFIGHEYSNAHLLASQLTAPCQKKVVSSRAALEEKLNKSVTDAYREMNKETFRAMELEIILDLLKEETIILLDSDSVRNEKLWPFLDEQLTIYSRLDADAAWRRATNNSEFHLSEQNFIAQFKYLDRIYRSLAKVFLPLNYHGGPEINRLASSLNFLANDYDGRKRMVWAESPDSDNYPVFIGRGIIDILHYSNFNEILGLNPNISHQQKLIIDNNVLNNHQSLFNTQEQVLKLDISEEQKNLTTFADVQQHLVATESNREDILLACGGGVTGDLVGFAAATFQRYGMPLVQIPTTLLAQVDASVGGKTGVNIQEAKNWIGAYYPPRAVVADLNFLQTLSAAEKSAAFAEISRTALVADTALWDYLQKLDEPITSEAFDWHALEHIITSCLLDKIDIVSNDALDKNKRMILNFGHTVAHALESVTEYKRYSHGQAVALGILAALKLSNQKQLLEQSKKFFKYHGLAITLDEEIDIESVISFMHNDKKHLPDCQDNEIPLILLEELGKVQQQSNSVLIPVDENRIRIALKSTSPE